MENLKELILIAIQASVFLMVFAVGLDASLDDAIYVLKRPALLLRSLFVIVLIVPLVAVLITASFPLSLTAKIGILLMAVSPLPPLIPGREIKLGERKSYVYGLLVAVSLLSIVIVPLSVAIISGVFHKDVEISVNEVWKLMLKSVFLPLAAGMLMRHFAPQPAKRAGTLAGKIANILLVAGALPVLFAIWPEMKHLIGNGTIVAIVSVVAVGLLAGHLCGGPDPRDRETLAISSSFRHPGIALLIAAPNFPEPEVKAAILLFVIVGVLTSIPYEVWHKRRYPAHRA